MGPCGSVGAHIKTGRSPMAQDHFKTPPDPKKGHGMTKNPQKKKELELAKFFPDWSLHWDHAIAIILIRPVAELAIIFKAAFTWQECSWMSKKRR